jgi:hypothetical protein
LIESHKYSQVFGRKNWNITTVPGRVFADFESLLDHGSRPPKNEVVHGRQLVTARCGAIIFLSSVIYFLHGRHFGLRWWSSSLQLEGT